MRRSHHLAQLNLGLFRAPLDSDEMREFRLALEPVNAIAEATPGFVWRLQDDSGGSSSNVAVPGLDSELWAPNMSVWESFEALQHFMYKSGHSSYLRRRSEWFERPDGLINVLWWIPAGEIPTLEDAVRRLRHLEAHGPSQEGWDLRRRLDPPD
ncbi:MAG: DUF3291 domain-containing protein [Ilumatobacter sp.]